MKKPLLILSAMAALLAIDCYAQAETNAPAPPASAPAASPARLAVEAGKNLWLELKNLDLKSGVTAEPFGIVHRGDAGFGLAINTIRTNGLSLGVALAAVDEKTGRIVKGKPEKKFTFYDTTFNVRWNEPATIPFIGITVDASIETGLAVDIAHPKTVYSQTLTAFGKTWHINKRTSAGLNGGVGYLSKWSDGPFYLFGASFTRLTGGRGPLGLF